MTTVKAQEKHVSVNGVRLRYLDWGTEGKMPLVCLHGHTGQAHIWDEFAEAMSPHYHVYSVDQRGHGGSEWADTGYLRDRFVEDLTAFVDSLGLSKFVLAGLSMGGWHSLLYTADHPERVERIIIVDIAPEPNPAAAEERKSRPPTPLVFSSFEDALAWKRQRDPWASDARLRQDGEHQLTQREDGLWTWKGDFRLFNIQLPDMTHPGLIGRYWKAIETIPCPILEVRGTASSLVSDEIIQRMGKLGKQFRSVDVADAGHEVTVDKPHEFIEVTREFLGVPA